MNIQTSRPLVSVIVNNYNYGHFLDAAIKSALHQEYQPVEVIVVDDGSTDNSLQIIESFSTQVVPVLKENGGQASAFNAGFEKSSGEIVIFLDADDLLEPTAVGNAVEVFHSGDCVKVHWPLWEIDQAGSRSGQLIPRDELATGWLRDEILHNGKIGSNHSPTSGNAWSRSYLQQVLPIAENGDHHGADGALRLLAPLYGRIERIEEPQGAYRVHSGNFSGGRGMLFSFERDRRRTQLYFKLLATHASRLNLSFDESRWTGRDSYFAWSGNILQSRRYITEAVPLGSRIVLVDQCDLGQQLLPEYDAIPFLERDGEYWGPPNNDSQAVQELERLRNGGAQFVVFAFPAFWWLETYTEFQSYLRNRFACVLANDHVVIFDMREP